MKRNVLTRQRPKLYLFVTFLFLYSLTSAGTLTSLDGSIMHDTTTAIVVRHTLALPPHHHGLPGVHGQFFSKYGIAQSIAEIPLYLVGQIFIARITSPLGNESALAVTMLTNAIIMSLAVVAFFSLVYEIGSDNYGATIAALLIGLASPYWPYSKTDFSEPLFALTITGIALFLVRGRNHPDAAAKSFALAGLSFALALLTKLTVLVTLPTVAGYALYVSATSARSKRSFALRCLSLMTPIILGLVIVATYDLIRYGHIADTGYRGDDVPFHAPILYGLQGLLISSGKGLVWYCPLVVLALILWPQFLKSNPAEGLLAIGIILPMLATLATYPVWWGGFCWGPRYLLPVLALALLPLAFMRTVHSRLIHHIKISIIPLSILVQILGFSVHPARFIGTGLSDKQYLWLVNDSPLLGHLWLIIYDVTTAIHPSMAARMLKSYPWQHHSGISPTQQYVITHWHYWWWQVLERYGLNRVAQLVIIGTLSLGIFTTANRLRTSLHRHPIKWAALRSIVSK